MRPAFLTAQRRIDMYWEKDGFILRPATQEDAQAYYHTNFAPLDPEIARLTGSKSHFTREEVVNFFMQCREADDRMDFLLIAPDGKIIGESVLNEMDPKLKSANFRIAIFQPAYLQKGLGSWMIEKTLEYGFGVAKLHRISLSVFSFNPRAIHVYEKAGFHQEGILVDAAMDGNTYADEILMAMLGHDWRRQNAIL